MAELISPARAAGGRNFRHPGGAGGWWGTGGRVGGMAGEHFVIRAGRADGGARQTHTGGARDLKTGE